MIFVCFHFMPWPHLPADFEQRYESAWLTLPNSLYDPARGHAFSTASTSTSSRWPRRSASTRWG